MPSRSPLARGTLLAVALLLGASAMLLSGCDEATELGPEEQRIRVGAAPRSVCPSPPSPAGGEGTGESTIVATVFGDDGSVQEGLPVELTATRGLLEESSLTTSRAGQVQTTLSVTRLDDSPVVVTAQTGGGTVDQVELAVPAPPGVAIGTSSTQPFIGRATLTLVFQAGPACNVTEVRFELSYDPEVLDLSERFDSGAPWVDETGAFNAVAVGGGFIPTILEVDENEAAGTLEVLYRRDDVPRTGLTTPLQASLLTMNFDVLATGDAELSLDQVQVIPLDGRPYPISPDQIRVPEITGTEVPSDEES
jgi:hypothetical protein